MPTTTAVVTSAWTPPATIAGFSGTASEPDSHITLNWTVSGLLDAEFAGYRIYRRVYGEALWTTLVDLPIKATVSYEDNSAGQTVLYEYIITQFQVVVGDVPLESLPSAIVTISLTTDAWFVVMYTPIDVLALELNVTDESHTAVSQQEVFEPLATNFKRVVRGNILGDEGSLTARFDVSEATSAKQSIEYVIAYKGPHILKSPFGDVWFVEFDAPGYKYLPGGHLQITMGWVQIA